MSAARAEAEASAPEAAEGIVSYLRSQDDLRLAVRVFGQARPGRLPVICLAGLSRNSLDFVPLARALATHPTEPRLVVAIDSRGRGLSDRDRNWRNYNPVTEAGDVLAVADALGIEHAILVGTSRGGILAMLLGSMRPTLGAAIVLNDIGPVIEGRGLARIKSYLSSAGGAPNWTAAIARVRDLMTPHFPALGAGDFEFYARALYAPSRRGLSPNFDRQLLKTMKAIDFSEPLPTLWPQFESLANRPLLSIRGENSDILSDRTVEAMADLHPDIEQLTVPGQGHAPLLNDNATIARIAAFAKHCDT